MFEKVADYYYRIMDYCALGPKDIYCARPAEVSSIFFFFWLFINISTFWSLLFHNLYADHQGDVAFFCLVQETHKEFVLNFQCHFSKLTDDGLRKTNFV